MKKSTLQATGIAVGLSTVLLAQANPFKAELLKTGYENGTTANGSAEKMTNGECGAGSCGADTTNLPDANMQDMNKLNEGEVRMEEETTVFMEESGMNDEPADKATDGRCGMSGQGN